MFAFWNLTEIFSFFPNIVYSWLAESVNVEPMDRSANCIVFFLSLFFGRAEQLVGIVVPTQGLKLSPQQCKCGVLTTGLPGDGPVLYLFN